MNRPRRQRQASPKSFLRRLGYDGELDPIFRDVIETNTERINLGIDIGTSSCAAYYAIVPKDESNPIEVEPEKLEIHRNNALMPAHVGLKSIPDTSHAELIFGTAVDEATEAGEMSWNDVWLDLKQADFLVRADDLPQEKKADVLKTHQRHKELLERAGTYDQIIFRHSWMEKEQIIKLRNVEDVFDKLLKYLLMEIKTAIEHKTVLSKSLVDALLSGDPDNDVADRVRVGIAIPEVWTWQRMVLYRLLRGAGYHSNLELLSEGRCALAKGLKNMVEAYRRKQEKIRVEALANLKNCVFLGIDDGGCTLDGAIMELVEAGSVVKVAVVGEGSSSYHGSNRANDIFKSRLPDIFGSEKLTKVLKRTKASEDQVVQNFERGFEVAKCSLDLSADEKQLIVYKGSQTVPRDRGSQADWNEKGLRLDRNVFLECLEDAVDEKFAKDGPIRRLLTQAQKVARRKKKIHVIFSGGGSKSRLLHQRAVEEFKGKAMVSFDGTGSASCVAEGACVVLSDPDLSQSVKKSRKSYGLVVAVEYDAMNPVHKSRSADKIPMLPHASQSSIAGKEDMLRTVIWKVRLNDPVRFQMEEEGMQQTIWTDNDGKDDPKDAPDGWTFELEVVETSDSVVGSVDHYSADHNSIVDCGILRIKIDKETAEYIGRKDESVTSSYGFQKDSDGLWRLDFDYVLSYQWRGMLQYFEVKIPKHGALRGEKLGANQPCKRWEFWERAEWKTAEEIWDSMRSED